VVEMVKTRAVRLEDVAYVNPRLSEKIDPSTFVSFVGMADLSADRAVTEAEDARPYSEVAKGYTPFQDGDLLVAKITPCFENGKIGQARLSCRLGFGSTEFHVVRPHPEIADSRFLLHFLRSPQFRAAGEMRMAGSGGQRRVPVDYVKQAQLHLPPFDEQRRIAAILDKADELRTKRRQALAQLDALTQSIFQATVEDAGALLPAMTLADLGLTFSSGKNLISSDGDAHEHNRVIKVNAVSGGVFQPSESKPLPRTYIPNEQHRIRTGDLLFTRASGSLDLIGISARVREAGAHLFLPDKIWRAEFTPGAKVCPEYLQSLFKTPAFRAFVNNAASGAAGVKNISQRSVLGFVVSAPEPAAQEEFAKHVSAIELLKDRHSAQLAELDALFGVLQHRAFKGEL
jgi:type I restriction enzyme S subunit